MKFPDEKLVVILLGLLGITGCGGGGGDSTSPPPPPPPPANATETVTFAETDFSEITVGASFQIAVQRSDDFGVELTVDEDITDLLAVTREGARLRIGFREDFVGDIRAQTLEGVVRLPALARVELEGSAQTTINGFTGSALEIALSGSSILESSSTTMDFLSATLAGNSQLLFENSPALPAAHVELTGSSLCTLNIMAGGTLTGSASGSSHLSYWGTNISLDVTTSNTASVTRLGDTRP